MKRDESEMKLTIMNQMCYSKLDVFIDAECGVEKKFKGHRTRGRQGRSTNPRDASSCTFLLHFNNKKISIFPALLV